MDVEIILQRTNKTYFEGEDIKGTVRIACNGNGDHKHDGVMIFLDGSAHVAYEIPPKSELR